MADVKRKRKRPTKAGSGSSSAKRRGSAIETSTFDGEMVSDEFKPMSKVARKRWAHASRRAPTPNPRKGLTLQAAGHAELLRRIKEERSQLNALLERTRGLGCEDRIYRFYHHSFKVFDLQQQTSEIVATLSSLSPDRRLNELFLEIVDEGTGKQFSDDMNADWTRHTRPILEAFFHARYFLEMTVRYASLPSPPSVLPSGWAALLTLYRLR